VTAIVVLGGMGSQMGIVLAAILYVSLSELFRPLAEYRMLVFGAAMILIMRFRPGGLLSTRRPTALLE
jgi:branched-chain amino acid transport system permease protein